MTLGRPNTACLTIGHSFFDLKSASKVEESPQTSLNNSFEGHQMHFITYYLENKI